MHRRSSSRSKRAARALSLIAALLLGGCTTVSYYAQAVRGQAEVLAAARPVDDVLADQATSADVRERLLQLATLRQFAFDELALDDSGSYSRYADLDREAMVWSIVAAPVDSLEPRQWCYPVIGCASYRGYFDRAAAQRYQQQLSLAGWDVALEPVPAYSTLGWFDDPLPSTVIHWPLTDIAALLFHELAHETLYARDDSAFNEAFATLIEREGVRRWLASHGDAQARAAHRQASVRRADFMRLLQHTRGRLSRLYAAAPGRSELLLRKQAIIDELGQAYQTQRQAWGGYAGYDRWFGRALNNAHFASVATYNDRVPALRQLLAQVDGDLGRFIAACRTLAELPLDQRRARLDELQALAVSPAPAGSAGAAH